MHVAEVARSLKIDLTEARDKADALLEHYARPNEPVPTREIIQAVGCEIAEVDEEQWRKAPDFCQSLSAIYEPDPRTVWIRRGSSTARLETAIAHELGHDQIPAQAQILRIDKISRDRIKPDLWNWMEAQARGFSFYFRLGGRWFFEAMTRSDWGLKTPIGHSVSYGVSPIMALEEYIKIADKACVLRVFDRSIDEKGDPSLRFRRYIHSHSSSHANPVSVRSHWPRNHLIYQLSHPINPTNRMGFDGNCYHEVIEVEGQVIALSW